MDGGLTQSHRSLTLVSDNPGETSEDPGSSNGNGDKRCGRHNNWRSLKSDCLVPEVRA